MHIELCDLCHKKIPNRELGYSVGRGYLFATSRLCSKCGKPLEATLKKIEVAARKSDT